MKKQLLKSKSVDLKTVAWAGAASAVVAFLLLYRLGTLTHGLSSGEIAAQTTNSIGAIWDNPLYLPLKLARLVIFGIAPQPGDFLQRLPSALFGALALYAYVRILRHWYGFKVAVYGAVLFGASSWFLHASRLATFDSLYLWAISVLIIMSLAIQKYTESTKIIFAAPVVISLLLYIPGLVWLVGISLVWHWRDWLKGWQHLAGKSWQQPTWVALWVICLFSLVISFVRAPSLLQTWLGAPENFSSIGTIAGNFGNVFKHIFVSGAHQPELWLAGLPVLTIFTTVMFLVGAYFYARHWQAPRSRALLVYILVSAALIALGGPVRLSLVVPLLFIVAVAGIGYLLRDWFKVFPLNPLARSIGIAVVALAVGFTCWYNLRHYFVAWPNSTQTKAAFREISKN